MSLEAPHQADSAYFTPLLSLGRQQLGSPEQSDVVGSKPSVPKLVFSTMGKSGKPPPSTTIDNNMQSSLLSKTEDFVRRVWAPLQESGPPTGISDVTTDLRTGSNSDELGEVREANRIAARVAAAVELVVARESSEDDPALAPDEIDVLLVDRDRNARLVTLDMTAFPNLAVQQRVKLAASQEMQVEPRSIQLFDANDNLLITNCETCRALADISSMPLKAAVSRSPFVSQDDVNIVDCSAVSDVLLGSEPACDCEIGMPEPTDSTNHIKCDRLIALEQRLEATVSNIIGEIAQEKRVRQSVCEALTERLDSMASFVESTIGNRQAVFPAGSDRTRRPVLDNVLAQNGLTAPPSAIEAFLDPRCKALLSASQRDLEIAEEALHDEHAKKILNVERSVMRICNELAGRLCKVEHESDLHRRHVVELETARVADSLRLHSLCQANSAELQSQFSSLKVQAECLSTAIDGILQWVNEGEPTGFLAVLEERLASGGKINEGSTFESSDMRSQLLAVRSAVEKRRAANRAGAVSQPTIDNHVSLSKVEVPVVGTTQSWSPIVQSRVLLGTTPSSTCGESGKLAMPPVRSQSLEVPNASKGSLRTLQGQMRASSPFQVQRLTASCSRASSAELKATTPPRPSSQYNSPDYRSAIRSRSPASNYRHNTYVTNVNTLPSQSSVSTTVTSLQTAMTQSPTAYLGTTVQSSLNSPSPSLSSATSVTSTLGNATFGIGLGFGLQEHLPPMSRATMPAPRVTQQQSQSRNGSQQITSMQNVSPSMKLEIGGARSVSPPRTMRVDGSPKGAAPAQERVSRPFRRLISNSIGIGSD